MNKKFDTTSIDGVITPTRDAKVPVMDRGFLYGDSVYEVFRTYSAVPFLYDEHWARFENSARLIYMDIGLSYEAMREQIARTIEASGALDAGQDVYVRYSVTRGEGPIGLAPPQDTPGRCVIMVKALPGWNKDFYEAGVIAAVPALRRNPSDALSPNIKGGNYLNNVLGLIQAQQLGANECVFLNHKNEVTEASNSNVFFVLGGTATTPSDESGLLRGLTKQVVTEICQAEGIACEQRRISEDELGDAKECFLTSSTREVMPVKSLRLSSGEMLEFPAGGGETTRTLMSKYKAYVAEYVGQWQHAAFGKLSA